MKVFSCLFFAAALALGCADDARAQYISCDRCSEHQMYDVAKYSGDGGYTVYNITDGLLMNYNVYGWGRGEIEFGAEVEVTLVPPTAAEMEAIRELQGLAQIYGAPLMMSIDIPVSEFRQAAPMLPGRITAYDIQGDANVRSMIRERIESRMSVRQGFVAGVRRMADIIVGRFGGQMNYEVRVRVITDDGGRIDFVRRNSEAEFKLDPGSGKFGDGQLLPYANNQENAGTWIFSGGHGADDFILAMMDVGAYLDNVNYVEGSTVGWNCYWDAHSSKLYCAKLLL